MWCRTALGRSRAAHDRAAIAGQIVALRAPVQRLHAAIAQLNQAGSLAEAQALAAQVAQDVAVLDERTRTVVATLQAALRR